MKIKYIVAASPEVEVHTTSRDFFFATPGEIVTLSPLICTNEKKREACGCGRSLGGINTMVSSTLFVVVEGDEEEFRQQINTSLLISDYEQIMTREVMWKQFITPLLNAVSTFQVGDILRIGQTPTKFQLWRAS